MDSSKYILLTVDVEDWFQVENFRQWNPHSTWDSRELRVERNVQRLLDLFDETEDRGQKTEDREGNLRQRWIGSDHFHPVSDPYKNKSQNSCRSCQNKNLKSNPFNNEPNESDQLNQLNHPPNSSEAEYNSRQTTDNRPTKKVQATFFILGWLAQRLPHLVREIQSRGHEVASHGYDHELPNLLSPDNLKDDLIKSKKLLEDIIGESVTGYRAPSFAISDDILKTIGDCGYQYDSSYNSFSLHGRYGKIFLNGAGQIGIAHEISQNFYELPISNLKLAGQILPWGGGGYFRLLPTSIFNLGVKNIIKQEHTYVFYAHPWEFDPNQPRVNQASFSFKFRHYINLSKTRKRLQSLIRSFSSYHFVTCSQYLRRINVYY